MKNKNKTWWERNWKGIVIGTAFSIVVLIFIFGFLNSINSPPQQIYDLSFDNRSEEINNFIDSERANYLSVNSTYFHTGKLTIACNYTDYLILTKGNKIKLVNLTKLCEEIE